MTTAYVATIGGHVSELVELAGRLAGRGEDEVWITNDSAQTRDLLAGRSVHYVPFIGERDWLGVARALVRARRVLSDHEVTRVISTGSAIALGYLPVAAAMGIEAHYIESSTRVRASSVTGAILSRTPGVRCWWQFDPPPPRFRYLGGVYDRYRSVQHPAHEAGRSPRVERVVVTVGTTQHDFRRLIERLANIMPPEAEVLWQTGMSDITGLGIDGQQMVDESVLIDAIERADVVVSHAGAGSLALALRAGKIPLLVPRRAALGEQIDDHQVDLARWAHDQGLAVWAEADEVSTSHIDAIVARRAVTRPVRELVLT